MTVFTQVSSNPSTKYIPIFCFKGTGSPAVLKKMNIPPGVHVFWSEKGSYRLDTTLATIALLPNNTHIYTMKNWKIYMIDDYAVHLMPEVTIALLKLGWFPLIIGGGVTGDIQGGIF